MSGLRGEFLGAGYARTPAQMSEEEGGKVKRAALLLLASLVPLFGQGTVANPLGGATDAYYRALRLKIERDRQQSEAELNRSIKARLDAEVEQMRLQSQQADKTAGSYNGRYWTRCPTEVKAGIVVGFAIAMHETGVVPAQAREMFDMPGTVGALVSALDEFYRQDDVQIPIWLAMRLIKLRQAGASEAEIAAEWTRVARPVTPAK